MIGGLPFKIKPVVFGQLPLKIKPVTRCVVFSQLPNILCVLSNLFSKSDTLYVQGICTQEPLNAVMLLNSALKVSPENRNEKKPHKQDKMSSLRF